METVIAVDGISVSYRAVHAVRDVSIRLRTGITALVGLNGAGKTSLLDCLSTLRAPDRGSITWEQRDLRTDRAARERYRAVLGVVPQASVASRWLTAAEYVAYAGTLKGLPVDPKGVAVDEALERVDLLAERDRAMTRLSGGELRRLMLAGALVHRPAVVLLDEPTTGLDPVQREDVRRLLGLLGDTTTVLLSTHLVEDVASVADRVLVMREGRLVAELETTDVTPSRDSAELEAYVLPLLTAPSGTE